MKIQTLSGRALDQRMVAIRLSALAVLVGITAVALSHAGHAEGIKGGAMDHSKMDHSKMDHSKMDHAMPGGDDPHAAHRQMLARSGYERSEHAYAAPDVRLVDQGGAARPLQALLATDKPLLLNFVYTTCTTICPVLTATFSQVQQELGAEAATVRMVSISIDPEQDTPARLRAYAERFDAGPQWTFLTGALPDVVAVEKAFDIFRGSKTNHEPVTYLRAPGRDDWVRIQGVASAREIVGEYRALLASARR
jgi:protein SCO1/2